MRAAIYFDSALPVQQQVAVLSDRLKKQGDDNHENYYHVYDGVAYNYNFERQDGIEIGLQRNPSYLESHMDYDLFRNMLEYNDDALNLPEAESIQNITGALQLLWEAGIPTFVEGYEEYALPFNGGIDGPVPWPQPE